MVVQTSMTNEPLGYFTAFTAHQCPFLGKKFFHPDDFFGFHVSEKRWERDGIVEVARLVSFSCYPDCKEGMAMYMR